MTSLTPFISFRDVQVEYPGRVTGLAGVSLTISRGEFVFFVGKTGAGKSTVLRLLTRETRPTSGDVILNGRDVGRLREGEVAGLRREMGIVPQNFALLPRKRVWENVAYAMRAVGHSRRAVRQRVPDILEQVSIAHRADAYPHELSGGECQRVAIARALINNPPLLIADEPTGNLDPQVSWEIMEVLKGLNLKGTTVLVASHDMMVVERMGKRIVAMDRGRIASDTPSRPGLEVDLSYSSRNYEPSPSPEVNEVRPAESAPIETRAVEAEPVNEVPIELRPTEPLPWQKEIAEDA